MSTNVSLSFAQLPDGDLDNFAHTVVSGLTGNTAFASPPVPLTEITAAATDFTGKIAAAQTGGPADTAAKNNARQSLIGKLRQTAAFVQMKCNDDLSVLLSSGFQAQSRNRASIQLTQPQGLEIKNGLSGQLIASVTPVKNANMYEGRIKLDGDWLPSVFTGDSQHITFNGLSPGKVYTVQVRSLGGATGQSDWSDSTTHMAM